MFILISLLMSSLFAHDDIVAVDCELNQQRASIKKLKKDQYQINLPGAKPYLFKTSPKVEDIWNAELKQLFDTYTFENKELKVVVQKPETKGPVTETKLTHNGITYICK